MKISAGVDKIARDTSLAAAFAKYIEENNILNTPKYIISNIDKGLITEKKNYKQPQVIDKDTLLTLYPKGTKKFRGIRATLKLFLKHELVSPFDIAKKIDKDIKKERFVKSKAMMKKVEHRIRSLRFVIRDHGFTIRKVGEKYKLKLK